jgi:hypothetical protein
METATVEEIIADLKADPQRRVAECLAAWSHGAIV